MKFQKMLYSDLQVDYTRYLHDGSIFLAELSIRMDPFHSI